MSLWYGGNDECNALSCSWGAAGNGLLVGMLSWVEESGYERWSVFPNVCFWCSSVCGCTACTGTVSRNEGCDEASIAELLDVVSLQGSCNEQLKFVDPFRDTFGWFVRHFIEKGLRISVGR